MNEFVPRVPFVTAEHHVDYTRILTHIDTRRAATERSCATVARRLAWLAVHQPERHHHATVDELATRLERTLFATARFGYREARSEITSLRRDRAPQPVTASHVFPDAGRHGRIAKGGLAAIRQLIAERARTTAADVASAAQSSTRLAKAEAPAALRVAAAALAASKVLHNNVLELVGETLNLGRTAGITSLARPPEYAMRSEQLDANTCDPCDGFHGSIVEIGTTEYYELMPPSGCDGGGRCRGIYVYGDSADDVSQQQAA